MGHTCSTHVGHKCINILAGKPKGRRSIRRREMNLNETRSVISDMKHAG